MIYIDLKITSSVAGDLIKYHQKQPLTGGDTLKYPCPRYSASAIEELFDEAKK